MRCIVCDNETNGGTCSRCGCPVVVTLKEGDIDQEYITMAMAYRKNIIENSKIETEYDEFDLKKDPPFVRTVRIGTNTGLGQLKEGEITWFDYQYPCYIEEDTITVRVYITTQKKGEVIREINMKLPDKTRFHGFGIKAGPFLNYRLVSGTEENYTESSDFCLLD